VTYETPFQRRLREEREAEELAAKVSQPLAAPAKLRVAIPGMDDFVVEKDNTPEAKAARKDTFDIQFDQIMAELDILAAYDKWIGGTRQEARGRTESIKVSCPIPGHADEHPSAWVNTVKKTWYCEVCSTGGDAYDLFAYGNGLPVPGYKEGDLYGQVRKLIASDLGYSLGTGSSGPYIMAGPEASNEGVVLPGTPEGEEGSQEADVEYLPGSEPEEEVELPGFDWRQVITPGTFLDKWMNTVAVNDDIPEEYYLWNGLVAIGQALGRNVKLYDGRPVLGNLFICTVGTSGSGKSQANGLLRQLLREALPFDPADPNTTGTNFVGSPGSGEYLIESFNHSVDGTALGFSGTVRVPMRGIIQFSELSGLISRQARIGSTMEQTLLQFYDGDEVIDSGALTSGKKIAEHAYASLLTTTQPNSLKKLMSASDAYSGFANRFVFATGKKKKRQAIRRIRLDPALCVVPLQEIRNYALVEREIEWEEPAEKLYEQIFEDTLLPTQESDPMLGRLVLLSKKLILLFAANEMLEKVTETCVRKMEAMLPYILETYGVTSKHVGVTINNEIAQDILDQIARYGPKSGHPAGVTFRDIKRRLARKKYDEIQFTKVLESLVKSDQVARWEPPAGKIGRPTIRYRTV